jgi:hypothetical protein
MAIVKSEQTVTLKMTVEEAAILSHFLSKQYNHIDSLMGYGKLRMDLLHHIGVSNSLLLQTIDVLEKRIIKSTKLQVNRQFAKDQIFKDPK